MSKKDLYQTLRSLGDQGYQVKKTKKHIKIRTPKGQLFTCSSSPSCPNAHRQLLRDIRRYSR